MGIINVLPSEVYNQISAGEVVERPFSVVKELIENAIDAGATSLTIEIENGGTSFIRVTDDGKGIGFEDLKRAFLPHATSKISVAKDLEHISTLGFRGEALASIGAVSRAKIASLEKGSVVAYEISCEGGVLSSVEESSVSVGTVVTVEDLFFNTPARAKFLKTPKGEESDISNIVSRLILANPTVSFEYIADGKTIYRSFGGNAEEALLSVYGKDAVENSFYIDTAKHGLHIRGYLGKHHFTKANRTYQTVILNGRYVNNQTVSSAVHNAYQSYLMKRNYPFYCLYIDLPSEFVDVNVHPNKTDVRFANNQVVYGALYSVISAVLDGSTAAIDIVKSVGGGISASAKDPTLQDSTLKMAAKQTQIGDTLYEGDKPFKGEENSSKTLSPGLFEDVKNAEVNPKIGRAADYFSTASSLRVEEKPLLTEEEKNAIFEENKRFLASLEQKSQKKNLNIDDASSKSVTDSEKTLNHPLELRNSQVGADLVEKMPKSSAIFGENSFTKEQNLSNKEIQPLQSGGEVLVKPAESPVSILENMTYVGQVFKTYLVFECGATMYLVDQHAAHERMIYDRLKQQVKERKVVTQPMLLPYVLTLNPQESAFIKEKLPDFVQMGFEMEEFGSNSFKISALPVDLCDVDLSDFFKKVLDGLESAKNISVGELFKEKIMQTACKAAIKAGFSISQGEIALISEKLSQNPGLTCPHGRPVAVKVSKTELEKWFKRIV